MVRIIRSWRRIQDYSSSRIDLTLFYNEISNLATAKRYERRNQEVDH